MMNKEQYLNELKGDLQSLSEQEQADALAFYEEYLSDMEENNPEKLEALEAPQEIAAQIKADAAIKSTEEKDIKKKKGISTAWAVLLAVLALPIGLPLAVAFAAVAIALIIVVLSLVIALFAVVLSLAVSAIFSLVAGVTLLATDPSVGLFYLGCGLFGLSAGYILGIGVYDLSKRLFIWLARFFNRVRVKMQNKKANKEVA